MGDPCIVVETVETSRCSRCSLVWGVWCFMHEYESDGLVMCRIYIISVSVFNWWKELVTIGVFVVDKRLYHLDYRLIQSRRKAIALCVKWSGVVFVWIQKVALLSDEIAIVVAALVRQELFKYTGLIASLLSGPIKSLVTISNTRLTLIGFRSAFGFRISGYLVSWMDIEWKSKRCPLSLFECISSIVANLWMLGTTNWLNSLPFFVNCLSP